MALIVLPRTPMRVSMRLRSNARIFEGTFAGNIQTVDPGVQKWAGAISFLNVTDNLFGPELMSWLAKMRGPGNRFSMGAQDNPKRGVYGGTPLVAGLSQTGNTLTIDGATVSVTDWIREGDYIGWNTPAGNPELHLCTADANSSAGGIVIVSIEPAIRISPADNAPVIVDDGVLGKPAGTFILTEPENGWDASPGNRRNMSFPFIEDIFLDMS